MHSSTDLTFDALVERYRQQLTSAAYHLSGNREAAYDIVQETLVDAYRGMQALRDPAKAGAWLYAILRRKAAAYHRARRSEVELTDESIAERAGEVESIVQDIVVEHMSNLPEEDREILAGKYLLGLSYAELAESLGVKEGAIRVRCYRAKERLREVLRGVGVSVPDKR